MGKKRVVHQTQVVTWHDIFNGAGDWEPIDTPSMRYELRQVEVKSPTKVQRKKIIERLIDKLDPPRKVTIAQKPKTVKRAPKPKVPPKPKKGKQVGNVNEVLLKSPGGRQQVIPLVPELRELLLDGWQIVGEETTVQEAYSFLNYNPEEMEHA